MQRDDGLALIRDILLQVQKGNYTENIAAGYVEYERSLIDQMKKEWTKEVAMYEEKESKRLKILILLAVADSATAVTNFVDNYNFLRQSKAKDEFEYAIFHHDLETTLWEKEALYKGLNSPVVMKHVGAGCKPHFWDMIEPSMAEKYDYVWILDEDMRFDFFVW